MIRDARTWATETFVAPIRAEEMKPLQIRAAMKIQTHLHQQPQQPLRPQLHLLQGQRK